MKASLFLVGTAIALPFAGPSCSSGSDTGDAGAPIVEVRADTNRNGTLDWDDPTEVQNKTTWDTTHGAIFLANIDDDQQSCPTKNSDGTLLSDVDFPKCNDAADTVINGPNDALNLAPLGVRGWPGAPPGTTASLSVDSASAPFIHFFIMRNGALTFFDWQNGNTISTAELTAGNVTLAIEATDIVRDPNVWNGYVTVHLAMNVGDGGTQGDDVKLRVAPVITRHQLAQEQQVFVTAYADDPDPSPCAPPFTRTWQARAKATAGRWALLPRTSTRSTATSRTERVSSPTTTSGRRTTSRSATCRCRRWAGSST